MQFNVAQLLKQPIGATREYELNDEIDGLDPELVPVSPLTGVVKLLRTHSGILLIGDLSISLEMTCNRCLEPVEMSASFHFEESFRPLTDVETGRFLMPQEFKGQQEELNDAALLIDDHHILDASEVIRQNIWLALPMYPGCMFEDPANCPNFALRMQEIEEVHSDLVELTTPDGEVIDPRWAALLALKQDDAD
ncbi:MAG: DUF177 domain-containing protein [Caldilineaceae bacterium]|nr:DUF177 domain-containing protein [Caldilineaceae bacterium]